MATSHEKHRPASHPVLRRATVTEQTADPEATFQLSNELDEIARAVAELPDCRATVVQRQRLRIIAKELLRRADGW